MLTIKAFVRLPRCLGLMKLNKFCFARAIREKKIEKQQDTSQENNNFQDEINNTKSLQKEIPTISTKNEYKQEKKVENKTESNKYNKKNIIEKDIESFETLIKSFNDCKQNFDMIFFLKFLNDAIKSKKLRVSKAKRDIDIKKNIYIDLLKIPEINECISVLKMNITEMENIQITNFLSLLSKIDYYDAELFAYISNRVVKKEINLNTVASSFLIWTLAKYKIKNDEMLEILTQNMLNHPIVN